MQGKYIGRSLLCVLVVACGLLTQPNTILGQNKSSEPLRAEPELTQKADLATLGPLLKQLQTQVQDMNSQLQTLRAQQEAAKAESAALRTELETAKAQFASIAHPPPAILASASAAEGRTPQLTPEDRINKIEENQQLADAKIAEQSQTKVESSSKYRVRLTGIVLFNMFGNQGNVENQDFPLLATAPGVLSSDGSFGASLRQSQIGLEGFGPTIAGAHTSANIQFDFAGGFPQTENGVSFGIVRLRTGSVRFDWDKTSIIAGQDSLFIAPLSPTSIATLAVPAFSYAGNLWSWTPQVRVEHRFAVSENSSFLVQGGILDSMTGDLPSFNNDRNPTWGERSKQPAFAARLAWNRAIHGENFTVGVGGYYNRQFWGYDRHTDGWAGTIDLLLPLTNRFEFSGQFYRGRATGGLGGGIGQSVLWTGSLLDPATEIYGLNSLGAWAQLKYKATSKLQFNLAFGQDNPYASDLRNFGRNSVYYAAPISKNQSTLVNFLYQPKSDIVFSLEYRRPQTFTLDSNSNTANILNLSVGYIF